METVSNKDFGGERPFFGAHDIILDNVNIHEGESAIKECRNIVARNCRFEGRYPFWHVDGLEIDNCVFTEEARAALWYSRGLKMTDTLIYAPKILREMDDIALVNVKVPVAQETIWKCRNVSLKNVEVEHADYIFFNCENIKIDGYRQQGNYSFQYCRNVEIRNAVIDTKDAFWNTENVTVYDSVIKGQYLGWHSKNLRLVNCRLSGTQPLCYADGLVLDNCEMADDCDLAFEYSDVNATVNGVIASVKNPRSGVIMAKGYGEIILDSNIKAPADCRIETV